MLVSMVPATSASETVVQNYDAAVGARVINSAAPREGLTLSWHICSTGWYEGGEDNDEDIGEDDGVETGVTWGDVNKGWNAGFGAACLALVDEDGDGFEIGLQGVSSPAGNVHTQVTASIDDDNFDAPYLVLCVYTGEDNICDDDDIAEVGCGAVSLDTGGALTGGDGSEEGDNVLTEFVSTVVLDAETFDLCLGSQGVVTTVFS